MKGLFHIYTGDGKGKSTAALGLALRASGQGLRVLYCQFLKSGESGEHAGLAVLKKYITVLQGQPVRGFLPQMETQESEKTIREQRRLFVSVLELSTAGQYDIVILDEVVTALNLGVLSLKELTDFVQQCSGELEVVFTGRDAPPELIELADYVSEIKKIKHPFDRDIHPRKGIEY